MSEPNKLWAPRFYLWAGILTTLPMVYFAAIHYHYYILPRSLRPISPHHEFLRSSGYAGLTFGAIGTVLIILNLSYLVRKEMVRSNWMGNLRSWIAFHIATGIIAYILILLHSDFLLRSALGTLALIGFTIVIFTGLIGRYIYAHTPRNLEGTELEIDDVRKRLKGYRADLEKWGLPKELLQTDLDSYKVALENKSVMASILTMLVGDQKLDRTYDQLEETVRKTPALHARRADVIPVARNYFKELEWLSRFHELRGLMSTWRFFHRWLAIVMISAVVFHVIIAQKMGHLWLFDREGLMQYESVVTAAFKSATGELKPAATQVQPAPAAVQPAAPVAKPPAAKPAKARSKKVIHHHR